MKYESTAYTYFQISGTDWDAYDFFETFHITPTKVGENRNGEKYFNYRIDAKDAIEGVEESLEKLSMIFSEKAVDIRLYAELKGLYIKIFVVIEIENREDNGFFLNKEFIDFLNKIGAEIEMDFYH